METSQAGVSTRGKVLTNRKLTVRVTTAHLCGASPRAQLVKNSLAMQETLG